MTTQFHMTREKLACKIDAHNFAIKELSSLISNLTGAAETFTLELNRLKNEATELDDAYHTLMQNAPAYEPSYIPEEDPLDDEELLKASRKVLQQCVMVNPYGSVKNAEVAREVRVNINALLDTLHKRLDNPQGETP